MAALDSGEILLEEINRRNGGVFIREDLSFGYPDVTEEFERNTTLLVTATKDSPYEGSQRIWYDRVGMTETFQEQGVEEVLIDARGASTVHELIPAINETYGLNLGPQDLQDAELRFDTFPASFSIEASRDSWVWIGGLDVVLVDGDVWLKYVITVTELNGLYGPDHQD
jgi:hypothetical protein